MNMIFDNHAPRETRGLNAGGMFSADVKLHLYVGEERFELGQLGPGFAILRESQAIASTNAELETVIDEKITRWPVRITSAITGDSMRFTFDSVAKDSLNNTVS
jgi:hypothetical protein